MNLFILQAWDTDTLKTYTVLQKCLSYLIQIEIAERNVHHLPNVQMSAHSKVVAIVQPFRTLLCAVNSLLSVEERNNTSLSIPHSRCIRLNENLSRYSSRAVRVMEQIHSFLSTFT